MCNGIYKQIYLPRECIPLCSSTLYLFILFFFFFFFSIILVPHIFKHILSQFSYVVDYEQWRKNGDHQQNNCGNKQSIIVYNIGHLWKSVRYINIVVFVENILFFSFSQFSVQFLLFSTITSLSLHHLLFLFHSALSVTFISHLCLFLFSFFFFFTTPL